MVELGFGLGAIVLAVIFFFMGKSSGIYKSKITDTFDKYAEYKPYALMASQWVEEKIDDVLPPNATKLQKSLFKLNTFLQKFNEIVRDDTGQTPSAAVMKAAKEWSMDLAEEMNYRKIADAAKEAKDAGNTDSTV